MKFKCPNCGNVVDKCNIKCKCGNVIIPSDIIKEVKEDE